MTIKTLFKSTLPNMGYVFKDGSNAPFVQGRFATEDSTKVAQLKPEAESRANPYIYIDENEKEIDTTLEDRISEAKAKAVQQVLAEHAAPTSGLRSAGDTMEPSKHIQGMVTSANDLNAAAKAGQSPAEMVSQAKQLTSAKLVTPASTKAK